MSKAVDAALFVLSLVVVLLSLASVLPGSRCVAAGAFSFLCLVPLLVLAAAKEEDLTPRGSQVFAWGARSLALLGSVLLAYGSLWFLRHPAVLAASTQCPALGGPCTSFRGSDAYGSWGPGPGWWTAIASAATALVTLAVSFARRPADSDYLRLGGR
eukprot:m51a1_g7547 hypothetical protein (157) ;mRNA; r:81766-82331